MASAILDWDDSGSRGTLFWIGMAAMLVALAAAGYTLVATAPVWLRAVVTVATVALGYMLWFLVDDGISADHLSALVAGVVLLAGGVVGQLRMRSAEPEDQAHGHRAVR